jgi:Fusaric acid resistance protein family
VSPIWFALRTTGAALAALALADGFNIQHPWWAAMSAWLVVQPTRRLLLERSLFRLAGTVCGALAGAFILHGLQDRPLLSIAAVTLWLALCAGLGSNFRHFRNYGFVLAGYTAAIVVLFSLGDRTHDVELQWIASSARSLESSARLSPRYAACPLVVGESRSSEWTRSFSAALIVWKHISAKVARKLRRIPSWSILPRSTALSMRRARDP